MTDLTPLVSKVIDRIALQLWWDNSVLCIGLPNLLDCVPPLPSADQRNVYFKLWNINIISYDGMYPNMLNQECF